MTRSRARGRSATGIVGSLLLAVSAWTGVVAGPARANGHAGLSIVGRLPDAPPSGHYVPGDGIIGVDDKSGVLYYMWRNGDVAPNVYYLREYDLRTRIPKVIKDIPIGAYGSNPGQIQIDKMSPYVVTSDDASHRLFMLAETEAGPEILVVDTATGHVLPPITLASQVPGFVPQGLTVSGRDRRIYLVGQMAGQALVTITDTAFNGPVPASLAVVVAVNERDGQVSWVLPVKQCQKPLDTASTGSLIARAADRPVLYFACARPGSYPGESGVVQILSKPSAGQHINPGFPINFFPISGAYGSSGIAAFDPKTERFFMQSIAFSTPGAWVLDGKLGAWIGLIAAPDDHDTYLGLNTRNGHYYMAGRYSTGTGPRGYITVADSRQTPIPEGLVDAGVNAERFISVDPSTNRLFLYMDLQQAGLSKDVSTGWVILQDHTPDASVPRPLNYDALTSNASEGAGSVTNFSGDVDGYGARALLVGGAGGTISFAGEPPSSVDSYDRGFAASAIPSVDLRSSGASATSQAAVVDNQSASQYQSVGSQGGAHPPALPWVPTSCLNAGGKAVTQTSADPAGAGQSSVTCDMADQKVDASSSFGRVSSSGVAVGSSSFTSHITRDEKRGIVNDTTAEARAVSISTPSGELSIARVTAEATTVAHGHRGTSLATWRRELSGIRVTDGSGTTQSIPDCETTLVLHAGGKAPRVQQDTCRQVASQIDDALGVRVRIQLPTPELDATPKGAFAAVQQSDADFYEGRTVNSQGVVFESENPSLRPVPAMQVILYNDGTQHSRAIWQLAAIQASSIYTISPLAPPGPIPGIPTTTTTVTTHTTASAPGTRPQVQIGVPGTKSHTLPAATQNPVQPTYVSPAGSLAFLVRSPKEALLTAATMLLFAGAGLMIARRRALLAVLVGKES